MCLKYFNPRPPRGGRPPYVSAYSGGKNISIHALREEGDIRGRAAPLSGIDFNPRPPRGGRPAPGRIRGYQARFQSTPSARRATRAVCDHEHQRAISIHALREEGDNSSSTDKHPQHNFNPRPPRGGRRSACQSVPHRADISIHALREEGDRAGAPTPQPARDFNPRPPRGGRLITSSAQTASYGFQSTPSARRATGSANKNHRGNRYFNPRPPRGGRLTTTQRHQR